MVDGTLLTLNIAGGFSVLMGYVFISLTGTGSQLYKVFTANEKTIFIIPPTPSGSYLAEGFVITSILFL